MNAQTADEAHRSMELYSEYKNKGNTWMFGTSTLSIGIGMMLLYLPVSEKYARIVLGVSLSIPVISWTIAMFYGIRSSKYYVPFYLNRFGRPATP